MMTESWVCSGCHMLFKALHVIPHVQHHPDCPATGPYEEVHDHDICVELGCTLEDVCDDCCNICNQDPVSLETVNTPKL